MRQIPSRWGSQQSQGLLCIASAAATELRVSVFRERSGEGAVTPSEEGRGGGGPILPHRALLMPREGGNPQGVLTD
ncbi:hypothetical protein AWR36_002700 [Microbulbifer flavimaris]|uniref:Uncharacterized protein n=1 Tax=Microbulbifer flavimaris TaxID=1781068 RepID=A0ABX4I4H1_9GAMM|nr:hypothetical protein AVO43_02705 [Microbulbifer sp. ZGT114]PCO06678.1 hypothetical protein AWR36_002700 [Microbulbifer flavimaris]